jgi:mono/diheme cytochrome c family protein
MGRLLLLRTSALASGLLLSLACADPATPGNEAAEESGSESPGDGDGDPTDTAETTESGESGETGEPECVGNGLWAYGHSIPMEAQSPGDPEAGRIALFEEDYVACGVPWELFGLAKGAIGSIGEGEMLAWRSGKNAQVPYSWNVNAAPDGSEFVSPNCLQCHAGHFNGELIIGLGRVDADYTTDIGTLMQAVPPLPAITDAGELMNKFVERYSAVGPWSQQRTVGTNPAIMLAVALVNYRNPFTLAWLDEPTMELPEGVIVAADPPPWWRVKKRAAQFINGMSRGDHRGTMILASSLCTDSAAEAAQILDYFADINAYLASLEPPEYPGPIDESLASEGEAIFLCECAGCHGTYDEDPANETYPNLLLPLDVIGTDAIMASAAAGDFNYLEEWFDDSYYGTVSRVETNNPFVGYVAPPLDGIWATAPYFHNGSVPSIELVLDSSSRPAYWKRVDFDSTNYDWETLGWPWEPAQSQANTAASERKYVYDTTIMSHSKTGHTFGDQLTAYERKAVLEYLKTI